MLKPDMFAAVTIYAGKQINAVVIPSEAVIRSGSRNQVFVVRTPGKFEPRLVTLGLASNGQVAVLDGVKVGEEVVTSAQFLIDSESKLREATAKMLQATSEDKQQPDQPESMQSMEMDQQGNTSDQSDDHSQMKQMNHQQNMPAKQVDHSAMQQMNSHVTDGSRRQEMTND